MEPFELELRDELTEMLHIAGVTLGGGETLAELQEMCEEMFGDEV